MLLITLSLGLVGVAQAQTTLQMTAPAGTKLTGTVQSNTTITGLTADVQPKPNVRLTSQALADYRKSFSGLGSIPPVNQTIPAALEVLPARADGGIPVQTNMDIPLGEGKEPLKFLSRAIHYPDGRISMEFDEVSDPTFQKLLGGMKDLVNSPETQAIYTRAWTPGETVKQDITLPFEQFVGGLPYQLTGNFTMTSSTSYVQRGAQDEYIFQVNGTSGLNEIRALDEEGRIVMKIFMDKVNITGETRIRKDGLPMLQRTNQSMKMTLIMNLPNLPVIVKTSMNLSVQQNISWQ
ncbi:hypothetical protein DC3_33860 [Deinococcus cellulosilyticus NBRC 106333 = KACC 11606]|uniref:Uncharacterized protein n=2 Tax=Deinococcus cellulosilyticus TaxID=401558 RepID=A0A511N5S6_DEIC1|nr:hypothetical protein DC3_33860 [Deinococcus cellulosilyticus NBRC 106333 = KACC 11606]